MSGGISLQAEIMPGIGALLLFTIVRMVAVWSEAHLAPGEATCFRCNAQSSLIDEHSDALVSGDHTVIEDSACPSCSHRKLCMFNDMHSWAEH